MGASENKQPAQMEYMEDWDSFGNADAGIAPCRESIYDDSNGNGGGGVIVGTQDQSGNGNPMVRICLNGHPVISRTSFSIIIRVTQKPHWIRFMSVAVFVALH